MRTHTVEIGDREGHTYKMEVSTPRTISVIRSGLAGDWAPADLSMTGLKEDDGKMGHIVAKNSKNLAGAWRMIDKNCLRFNSGKTFVRGVRAPDLTTRDVIMVNLDGTWGMVLWAYEDAIGVNDEGTGVVVQAWVAGIKPGRFSWTLAD